jgi:hypothetical protein
LQLIVTYKIRHKKQKQSASLTATSEIQASKPLVSVFLPFFFVSFIDFSFLRCLADRSRTEPPVGVKEVLDGGS